MNVNFNILIFQINIKNRLNLIKVLYPLSQLFSTLLYSVIYFYE